MRVAASVNRFLERMGYQIVRADTLNRIHNEHDQLTNALDRTASQLNVAVAALAERPSVTDVVREASEASWFAGSTSAARRRR
jgi:hypothetical protein